MAFVTQNASLSTTSLLRNGLKVTSRSFHPTSGLGLTSTFRTHVGRDIIYQVSTTDRHNSYLAESRKSLLDARNITTYIPPHNNKPEYIPLNIPVMNSLTFTEPPPITLPRRDANSVSTKPKDRLPEVRPISSQPYLGHTWTEHISPFERILKLLNFVEAPSPQQQNVEEEESTIVDENEEGQNRPTPKSDIPEPVPEGQPRSYPPAVNCLTYLEPPLPSQHTIWDNTPPNGDDDDSKVLDTRVQTQSDYRHAIEQKAMFYPPVVNCLTDLEPPPFEINNDQDQDRDTGFPKFNLRCLHSIELEPEKKVVDPRGDLPLKMPLAPDFGLDEWVKKREEAREKKREVMRMWLNEFTY